MSPFSRSLSCKLRTYYLYSRPHKETTYNDALQILRHRGH